MKQELVFGLLLGKPTAVRYFPFLYRISYSLTGLCMCVCVNVSVCMNVLIHAASVIFVNGESLSVTVEANKTMHLRETQASHTICDSQPLNPLSSSWSCLLFVCSDHSPTH